VVVESTKEFDLINRSNYKLTREFLDFLSEIKQLRPGSLHRYKLDLNHFLLWLDETAIEKCESKRPSFASFLLTSRMDDRNGSLGVDTQKKIVQTTRRFLHWLKLYHPHRFKSLPAVWIDSLKPPPGVEVPSEHEYVTLEEAIRLAKFSLEENKQVYLRDQAAVAVLFLSGMRAGAFSTLPIEAVDLPAMAVRQWPSLGVQTKNQKHATTYLLDVPLLMDVVRAWDSVVRSQLPPSAMWYAPINCDWSDRTVTPEMPGKNRNISLGKRLKKLSQMAGVPYKSPHKYRHGHAVYALLQAKTMADYKAISQNLMHGSINVTDSIYAWLNGDEIKQRIVTLGHNASGLKTADNELEDFLCRLSRTELKQAIIRGAQLLAD
jgi:site-specific recombinase XerD